MKIEFVHCKGVRELNGDCVIINENISLYGVADGVSSLFPFINEENHTGGFIASNEVKRYFEKLGHYNNLKDDFSKINTRLKNKMKEYNIDLSRKEQLWGSALAVVKISSDHIDFLQTGDCMILAIYQDDSVRTLTRVQTKLLEEKAINKWKGLMQKGIYKQEELMSNIKDILVSNRKKSNTPNGYGVLNGEEAAIKYTEHGRINKNGLKQLILITDGLFLPKECIPRGKNYWDYLAHSISSKGMKLYMNDLIELEESDPECLQYPRFKKSDDKAGIYITF